MKPASTVQFHIFMNSRVLPRYFRHIRVLIKFPTNIQNIHNLLIHQPSLRLLCTFYLLSRSVCSQSVNRMQLYLSSLNLLATVLPRVKLGGILLNVFLPNRHQ